MLVCVVCVIGSSVMYVLSTHYSFSTLANTVYATSSLSVFIRYGIYFAQLNVVCVQSYIIGTVQGPSLCGIVQSMEPRTCVDCIACICRMLSCVPSTFC